MDRTRVLEPSQGTSARYAEGRLLVLGARTLFAQAFDAQHLRMLGAPVPIVDQVQMDANVPGAGAFTVSETGVLAYEAAGTSSTSRLMWVDRGGKKLGVVGDPLPYLTVNLSPDGSRAASMISEAGQVSDVWIVDLTTGHRNRVTFDTGRKGNVVWSPDGTRIVYDSMRNGQTGIYQQASTGAGTESLLSANGSLGMPTSWSAGRSLLYTTGTPTTSVDMWILPLTGSRQPYPFRQTAASQYHS